MGQVTGQALKGHVLGAREQGKAAWPLGKAPQGCTPQWVHKNAHPTSTALALE